MFLKIVAALVCPPYGLYKACEKAEKIVDSIQKPFYFPEFDPQNERPNEDRRDESASN
jgi:hypothetical protein